MADEMHPAAVDRFNRRNQLDRPELPLVHWTEFYIPPNLVVLRPLTADERAAWADEGDRDKTIVFGLFDRESGSELACSSSYVNLKAEAREHGGVVTWLQ